MLYHKILAYKNLQQFFYENPNNKLTKQFFTYEKKVTQHYTLQVKCLITAFVNDLQTNIEQIFVEVEHALVIF